MPAELVNFSKSYILNLPNKWFTLLSKIGVSPFINFL